MYRIAISGKANSGKNTAATILQNILVGDYQYNSYGYGCKLMAFADPIKEIIRIMFPFLKKKWLYGPSKFRNQIIEGALDSENNPLTIRRALLEIGTKVGRGYKDSMWLDVFTHRFNKEVAKNIGAVIVTDVRFRNEFDYLKELGFFLIRINRETEVKINHSSETNQDQITNSEFDFVLNNNFGLEELTNTIVGQICPAIKNSHK